MKKKRPKLRTNFIIEGKYLVIQLEDISFRKNINLPAIIWQNSQNIIETQHLNNSSTLINSPQKLKNVQEETHNRRSRSSSRDIQPNKEDISPLNIFIPQQDWKKNTRKNNKEKIKEFRRNKKEIKKKWKKLQNSLSNESNITEINNITENNNNSRNNVEKFHINFEDLQKSFNSTENLENGEQINSGWTM